MVMDAFIEGADGVFVGACKRGECHYSSGNLHAEGKMELTRRLMSLAGINTGRLVMRMMSSAEGNKFTEFATAFQAEVGELGPMGKSEGIPAGELPIRLTALRKALAGRKLRWVVGKVVEFKEKGNLYGEVFTDHEIGRLLEETAMDEYRLREILERLEAGPRSVKTLASETGTPPKVVLRQMADLRKMGLAEIEGMDGDSAVWAPASNGKTYE
jgi:hypothetical protein